jgi:hypothetical protein
VQLLCLESVLAAAGRVAHRALQAASAGDVAFVAMEPTLSTIYWGVCTDRVANGALESALMYFKPREVLAAGALSDAAARLARAFVSASEGSTLEEIDSGAASRAARLQARACARALHDAAAMASRARNASGMRLRGALVPKKHTSAKHKALSDTQNVSGL